MANFLSAQGRKNFLTQVLIWANLIIRRPRFDKKKIFYLSFVSSHVPVTTGRAGKEEPGGEAFMARW